MITDSINKTKTGLFSFKKNNKNDKYKNSIKGLLVISTILFIGTFTNFVENRYQESKKIDSYEAYYNNLESYSNFKTSMDAVPYTDEMFNKDLSTFKKIYGNKENRSAVGYNTYHFLYAKTMLNNDPEKINKYVSYFKGNNEESYYRNNVWEKQSNYTKSLYKNEVDMKINAMTLGKTISFGITSKDIIKNRELYLKENNIYKYTYGLNKKDSDLYSRSDKNEKKAFDDNQTKEFYNFIDTASNNDLRKMFKAINSYQVIIASKHFGMRDRLELKSKEGYMSYIYNQNRYVFGSIEYLRDKYIPDEEKRFNRYRSLY